ncbi:MAG: DoxX family protein [Mycobacteriales bacterium]
MRPLPVLTDPAFLILRVALAVVFIAHGWDDIETGVGTNVENHRGAGIPLPEISAYFTAYMELFGGILLALGALTRLAASGLAFVMLGAWYFVHRGNGLFVDSGGSEFVLVLGAIAAALVLTGAGRFSIDRQISTWRSGREHLARGR